MTLKTVILFQTFTYCFFETTMHVLSDFYSAMNFELKDRMQIGPLSTLGMRNEVEKCEGRDGAMRT